MYSLYILVIIENTLHTLGKILTFLCMKVIFGMFRATNYFEYQQSGRK